MTNLSSLSSVIDAAWEARDALPLELEGPARAAAGETLALLDSGALRVSQPDGQGNWRTHEWVKKAILLSFRFNEYALVRAGLDEHGGAPFGAAWDKIPTKTAGWDSAKFQAAGFRMIPGAVVRYGAFIGRNAVLMPSFVNIGAHVGDGTMIDTWATVGSCAQIGRNVHISGGTGIGGVLEPLQASPVIIEDNCFIGARSEIAEGVIVREGAVISMGVFIGASTKIVDRQTGVISRGEVPPYAVVVPGALPDPGGGPALACAVIVKRVDAQTRAKTAVNDLLRDG